MQTHIILETFMNLKRKGSQQIAMYRDNTTATKGFRRCLHYVSLLSAVVAPLANNDILPLRVSLSNLRFPGESPRPGFHA